MNISRDEIPYELCRVALAFTPIPQYFYANYIFIKKEAKEKNVDTC